MLPTGEKELTRRFAVYGDEELLRILTVERAKYRGEALAAAELVLMRRGVEPPPAPLDAAPWPPLAEPPAGLGPPAARGRRRAGARPKSPYQFIDLCVDLMLLWLVIWGMSKLEGWAQTPWGSPWDEVIYCALGFGLLRSAISLRQKWRAKEWRD